MTSTGIEGLLKRVARIEGEIADLTGRVAAKQRERQEAIDEAKAILDGLSGQRPRGVGRGNHSTPRGPIKGTPNLRHRSLTDVQVREMRKLWAKGEHSQRELGEMFGGLPQPTVSSIVHRRTYKEVV